MLTKWWGVRFRALPLSVWYSPSQIAVGVGTIITDRPPHRSVRARLRIRLLPWINGGKLLAAHRPFPETCSSRSVSGACGIERCSPRPVPFPPQPPQKVSLPCSAGSQVLRHSPTSPARAGPPFGLWPSRTGLDPKTKACWRSPGSRACCFISVRGFLDYAGPDSHSRVTQPPYCLPHLGIESAS